MRELNRRSFLKVSGGIALLGVATYMGVAGCGMKETEKIKSASNQKTTLKLGYLPITDHLTLIALSRAAFSGVKVKAVKFASWPEIAESLKYGAIDAGFTLVPIGLELRQNGVPLKAVLLGHRNGSVITVKAGEEIQSLNDLRGKKVAIPSRFSTHNILIRKILAEKGIDALQVQLLELSPPEMVQALASGQIDAFIVAEPFGAQAELQKVGRVLMLSGEIWPDHICCVLNVREDFIEKGRDAIHELVNVLVDTGIFIENNPKEAAILSRDYLGQKPEVIEYVLTNPADRVTFHNLFPSREDFLATQLYMKEFNISTNTVDLDNYIDDSFARKAYNL
ncbi:MAG: ABC transporter substrate-binding protein [Dethiobacter sp.]|jgi:NitT/TauT family transport system substrate-binding protein|nr:MAG: ABC transporter substrate-binding protein [Dethiobacter sp.]